MVNIAILSGGTATNSILDIFHQLSTTSLIIDDNNTSPPSQNKHDQNQQSFIAHILPISDNGGSTSEIIRVLGGCSVGDLRSRITRLIPLSNPGLKELLSHRLPMDPQLAKFEWNCIVDGSHELWSNIDPPTKEIVRSFLIHVHTELLKRSRNSTKNFRFELASVGNLFLTGARLFCGSLDSAIELMLRICNVDTTIKVLPCLNTNFTYHISALLEDGSIITGQSQISHPSPKNIKKNTNGTADPRKELNNNLDLKQVNDAMTVVRIDSSTQYPPPITATPSASPPSSPGPSFPSSEYFSVTTNRSSTYRQVLSSKFLNYSSSSINDEELRGKKIVSQHVLYGSTITPLTSVDMQIDDKKEVELSDDDTDSDDENEFALPSYTHPELKKSQLHFDKDVNAPLPAPVDRIFYISPYGEEIYPLAQSRVIKCLTNSDLIIYSIELEFHQKRKFYY
ncbi:unnamed protein product [Ambrosiozyma monospora]|uniref:Unnamed protein product n=1 Tax=Ambrosiozyma monospora TaxID=43982 RepID=A0A9W7DI40_AMBMO|nr:unnamed protein product [Ambrosiozyma monospora]